MAGGRPDASGSMPAARQCRASYAEGEGLGRHVKWGGAKQKAPNSIESGAFLGITA
jgi:hypothetical protein